MLLKNAERVTHTDTQIRTPSGTLFLTTQDDKTFLIFRFHDIIGHSFRTEINQ